MGGRNGLPASTRRLLWGREITVHRGYRRATGPARGQGTCPPITAATRIEPGRCQWRELRRRLGHHGEDGGGGLRGRRGHYHLWRSSLGPEGSDGIAGKRAAVRSPVELSAWDARAREHHFPRARAAAGGDPEPPGPHVHAGARKSLPCGAGGSRAPAPGDQAHLR